MATVKWRRAAMGNNKRSRRVRPLTLTAAVLVAVDGYRRCWCCCCRYHHHHHHHYYYFHCRY